MRKILSLIVVLCAGATSWGYWHDHRSWLVRGSDFSLTQHLAQEQPLISALAHIMTHTEKRSLLWPGYSIKDRPLIVTFDSGRAYAFNFKTSDPSWKTRLLSEQTVLLNSSDSWGLSEIQTHHNFPIEGQQAFIYHVELLENTSLVEALRVLLRERFRVYQNEHFNKFNSKQHHFLGGLHVLNVTWMQIEEMILADFMNAQLDVERSNLHKASHLRDFLAVCRWRQQFITNETLVWEADQQCKEGLADYIALKAIESRLNVKIAEHLRSALQASTIDDEILERTTKGRHSVVGASLGYILDFLEVPDWKMRLQHDNINLIDLLSEVLDLDDEEIERRITKIKSRYVFNQVYHQVNTVMEIYYEETAELMREYQEMEGVEVALKCDAFANSNFESSFYKCYLKEGSEVSLIDTALVQTSDEQLSFKTLGMSAVMRKCNGDMFFKLENTAQITLDGFSVPIEILLNESDCRRFNSLLLQAQHCELRSTGLTGCIRVVGGCLEITYDNSKSDVGD